MLCDFWTLWKGGGGVGGGEKGASHSFFECFPYVCPEPVLAKLSFLERDIYIHIYVSWQNDRLYIYINIYGEKWHRW
eukprot:COSAG06_NODE_56954_length_282_cov_0.907104_1_plen_76_part_10